MSGMNYCQGYKMSDSESTLSKFQEKIAKLTDACENLTSEKKTLLSRIRQLEIENNVSRSSIVENEIASLKTKLKAAESLCEELMNENEEMKRELRDMEEEIGEMQDNFRENEFDEYSSVKKELEQMSKNCRILSFKLRKSERKAEQLEAEKLESERKSKEAIQKLQKELDDMNEKISLREIESARKKAPMLGNIPKVSSSEKVSRASLMRGGSQEDPAQLLRDLQDSVEREADLREQLRYAEEEAQNLRRKITRIEEDNESLLLQLKKIAIKAKCHRCSLCHLPVDEAVVEKDEGISDDDDPAELKVLLDLSEQEYSLAQLSKSDVESKYSSGNLEKKLLKALQEIEILTLKLKSLENEKLLGEQAAQAASTALNEEIFRFKAEADKMRISLEAERQANNQYKEEQTKVLRSKDTELKLLKKKLNGMGENRYDELKKDFDTKIDDLKSKLHSKQEEYQELTGKYEQLEEEHVKLKCQSNLQKEQLQSQTGCLQKELTIVQNELRTLRETYNCRQDGWIKEKLRLEEKVKDFEAYKSVDETHKAELNRLNLVLEMKEAELEHLRKNNVALIDQTEHMRKENEELSKKLDDFEKVINIQHNMVAESTSLDTQLRDLKTQLYNEKEGRKVEVAALKLRYENHVTAISDEMKDVQSQVLRLKHERDTYKHLLEKSMKPANMTSIGIPDTTTGLINSEEFKSQISSLEQQISCMEDELSEARIENSRLKTELMSERSAWNVQLSEMMSKMNQLEEERLLHSGRTKIVGLKTRMELSWQKEREEQIRLLQETSTLARDLRQTLFEVEREREKERLEMKRRTDQAKQNFEEEQEETKKKLQELQCDLLELRDAHAKLRTTNEKLRREKENSIRQNLRFYSNEINSSKIHRMLDIIYDLAKQSSFSPDKGLPPMPPKKHVFRDSSFDSKSASRESSITKEDSHLFQKLFDLAQQLREGTNHSSRDTMRKAFISKRPASTESDNTNEKNKTLQRRGSLYRKCISLEQTASNNEFYEPHIWRGDDDTDGSVISSVTSFQSTDEPCVQKFPYDSAFDSRLSGGSTHSEMLLSTLERKKKKGLLGKLKKLTKSSRSIDGSDEVLPSNFSNQTTLDSNASIIPNRKAVAKKDLKTRITGMFKSSDSRCNSMERSNSLHDNGTFNMSEVKDPITASQTLPRRMMPSCGKPGKPAYSESYQSGNTMPRIVSSKKQ